MGDSSKEPAQILVNRDYHIMELPPETTAPYGWRHAYSTRRDFSRAMSQKIYTEASKPDAVYYRPQRPRKWARKVYLFYLGPAPKRAWGPVCP